MSLTHEEMKDMYELYALGVLEREERAEIDEHLSSGCDVCSRAMKHAALTNAVVLSFAPEVEPPKRLRKRLLAGVGVEPKSWAWLAWAAASACLLVGLFWFSLESRRQSEELAAARRILDIVNSPETRAVSFGAGPRGNVYVNPKGVMLIATNLPALPPGKIFEMWVIPKGGAPKPAGLFRTSPHVLPGPIDMTNTGAVAVTVEPESGSDAPTSQPIIVAPMTGS
jgi:anti-sigma-K factor RskA